MTTRGPLHVLRRRWLSLLLVTVVALLAGLGYVLTAPVTYRASASAFFSLTAGNSAADLVQGSTYAQNEVASFAQLATTPAVLEPVVDYLKLPTTPQGLAQQVTASVPVGTVIVQVQVVDASPKRSAVLADEIVRSLSHLVERIAPKDDNGRATVVATTVAPAVVPTAQASPNVPLDLAAALVVGLLLGYAVAWLREALDTRVRDAGTLAELTELPLLGAVSAWSPQEGALVVTAAPHSPQAESFRQVRTNLQFLRSATDSGGTRVLSVTSALPGEGKSAISCNLALALAETGASVVLVDADVRRPVVAERLGLEGGVGLTTVLSGQADLDDVLQSWGPSGLSVLPSGAVPPNPAELLGSPAMQRLVERLRARFDHVVLDSPPVLPVADAMVVSRWVDGTILVAQAGRVRRGQIASALSNLAQVSAEVLGVVLNRLRREDHSYYGYGSTASNIGSDGATAVAAPGAPKAAGVRRESVPAGR